MSHDLKSVAATLVGDWEGNLAADETVPTLTKRFDTPGIQSTEQSSVFRSQVRGRRRPARRVRRRLSAGGRGIRTLGPPSEGQRFSRLPRPIRQFPFREKNQFLRDRDHRFESLSAMPPKNL
jgi:hypothetical protein